MYVWIGEEGSEQIGSALPCSNNAQLFHVFAASIPSVS
jgi:hypothetical protein